jgi:hypothetical protein
MVVEVWDWAVTREARSRPVGVSMKRDRARAALSRALVEAGRPAGRPERPWKGGI